MDITTNQLNAPVVADPTAPYGISKYAKSYLDALKTNAEDVVAKSNAQFQVVKSHVESEVSRLDASRNALKVEAEADRAAIRSELASETQARQSAISTLQTGLTNEIMSQREQIDMVTASNGNRLTALEVWKEANTDEISTEIDKAINSKVSQLSFDTIKADLEQADSQLAQNLAGAITARTEKDAEHDELLTRMEKFVNTLLSTYTLVDADGTAINTFADVVLAPATQPAP